jgi:uncharacterized protein YecE (DUF72 family)
VAELRVGCSGWNYKHWRASFYPPGCPPARWLERYAQEFDTVEVNATFYRLPSREAVARWVAQTPPGFFFAVKGSRYATHVKRLRDMDERIQRLYERIEPLATTPKMGPVLWQLPETFHADLDRLEAALSELPEGRHAFEFRHESWFRAELYDLLRAYGAALVIADHPQRPFQADEVTADFTYVRFHVGHRRRDGAYTRGELEGWAERLSARATEGIDVFAYFNNDWQEFAIRDARTLKRLLARQGAAA